MVLYTYIYTHTEFISSHFLNFLDAYQEGLQVHAVVHSSV